VIAYFDSSALVKLLVDEVGSEQAARLWDGADVLVSSRVSYAEVRAALAAASRSGRLGEREYRRAKKLWTGYWDAVRVIETGSYLDEDTGELAETHALSGFDAIHLAGAKAVGAPHLVLATWDARLHAAAVVLGYPTLPASL
jgi:predicted nucleic acid-binding protein